MPLMMTRDGKISATATTMDEEHVQNVFASWTYATKRSPSVLAQLEKLHKVDLAALKLQSEGIYDVEQYIEACDGLADEEVAAEAVRRAEAAWQPPERLAASLEAFIGCLGQPQIATVLKRTEYSVEEHVEVARDLLARAKAAKAQGATEVALETDASLI